VSTAHPTPDDEPRLVMVVNNAVSGDSRVQRCAATAAGAGWDVTVLGRSPDSERHELTGPGGVRVVLVPVPTVMAAGGWRTRLRTRTVVHPRLAERDRVAGHRGRPWVHGGWRVLDPWLADFELALADEIEALRPTVIHVHDRHPVPAVARSVAALRSKGHDVGWILDAHEDIAATASRGATGLRGWARRTMIAGAQDEWIREADAVLTVSPELAVTLQERHRLPTVPTVVLNAPQPPATGDGADTPVAGVRERIGLAPDVPLLVYSGSCAPARGLDTVIAALPILDSLRGHRDVRVAIVASPADPHLPGLLERAAAAGVGDRIHRVDYVPADQVVQLLGSADAGLVPLLHRPNHEISLITKYLEYLHAGIPVICSSVRTMAAFTVDHGLGEVFAAGDPEDLAQAAARVLADPTPYREHIRSSEAVAATAWSQQVERLLAVYRTVAERHGYEVPDRRHAPRGERAGSFAEELTDERTDTSADERAGEVER